MNGREMSNDKDLRKLAENRENILLAELATLLHDTGKLHLGHQAKYLRDKDKSNYSHTKFGPPRSRQFLQNFAGSFPQIRIMDEGSSLQEIIRDHHKRYLGNCQVANNVVCLIQRTDWLDSEYDRSDIITRGKQAILVQPTSSGFGIFSVFGHPACLYRLNQNLEKIRLTKADCSSNDKLTKLLCALKDWLADFLEHNQPNTLNNQLRRNLLKVIRFIFTKAAGDTRYSVNDITIWEHSWSVSVLTKLFASWTTLHNLKWTDKVQGKASEDKLSDVVKRHVKFTCWFHPQLLPIRIDGLAYLAQSNNIPDLLARRTLLTQIYDAIQDILEWEFPIAGEVYRDENGPVFLTFLRDKNGQNPILLSTLQLPEDSNGTTHVLHEAYLQALQKPKQPLESYLRQAVVELSHGDLTLPPVIPLFTYTQKSTKAAGEKSLGDLLADEKKQRLWLQADAKTIQDAWKDTEEICSVCGLRPQGYGAKDNNTRKKAIFRKICGVCLERRVDRAKPWTQGINKSSQERFWNRCPETVWLDDVADANGRLALIVGYFPLEHWLDGTLVESLAMFKRSPAAAGATNRKVQVTDEKGEKHEVVLGPKPASYSRLRRIWETTRRFWQDVAPTDTPPEELRNFCEGNNLKLKDLWEGPLSLEESVAGKVVGKAGPRLEIRDIPDEIQNQLGDYHAYELRFPQGVKMAVIWDPENRRLITAENLVYIARLLEWQIPSKKRGDSEQTYRAYLHQQAAHFVQEKLTNSTVTLEEPSHYGGRSRRLADFLITSNNVSTIANSIYVPLIPILAEPQVFMALVPADSALDVVQAIKAKYEREMGKVRNRLPLHLGIVFAPRMMPLRAILDAGRKMLTYQIPDSALHWEVVKIKTFGNTNNLCNNGGIRALQLLKCKELLQENPNQFKICQCIKIKNAYGKQIIWKVPALMGDGKTEDNWYPYVFMACASRYVVQNRNRYFWSFNPWTRTGTWLVHAGELQPGDQIYFTPATFDFIFMDSNVRRHEIAYNKEGRRHTDPRKPYLLDELDNLQKAWAHLQKLESSQRHKIIELIETKRQEWFNTSGNNKDMWLRSQEDKTFKEFCRATLLNANWKKHEKPSPSEINQLTEWAVSGLLTDAFELYTKILKSSDHE